MMSLAERTARRSPEARAAILAAVIGAAALVVSTIIEFSNGGATEKTGATVSLPGGGNVAVNSAGTVIQNFSTSAGTKSAFQSQHSMLILSADGYTAKGKTSLVFGTRNSSDRFIDNAEISAYSLTSPHPVFVAKTAYFGLGAGQMQPITTLTFAGQAPERLRFCLSFPAADKNAFLTALMDTRREAKGQYHFKYLMMSDYDVYFSKAHGDCDKRSVIRSVPASEYTGASS